jgi:two-component system cell cycle sensor histidine kinase/response regulator CckA
MFEGNPAIKLLLDPEGGAIVDASPAAVAFYGYSREELRRMRIQDLNQLPGELVDREMHLAREQQRSYFEFKHRLRSGELRDVQVYSAPCRVEGRTLLFSILVDITERKSLGEQLAHAQRMEALGRMAGGVAHDFNNLLAALEMVSGLISLKHDAEPEVNELRGLVQRGSAMTRQLLAFCRRQVLRSVLLDLGSLVRGMETLLRRSLGPAIALRMEIPDRPLPFLGDAVQVEQIVLNLALNARDAMPDGGSFSLVLDDLELTASSGSLAAGRYLVLEVLDNGVGMTHEQIQHIFEPFYTTKAKGEGVGLGLAVVYGVVHQYRGEITVESEPGQGTKFRVLLPRENNEEATGLSESGEPDSPLPQGNELILLVEDEPVIRRVVGDLLRKQGYRVVEAIDGVHGLEVAGQYPEIDLLLTDVVMPRLGGCDLAVELCKRRPSLRVLYMSGHQDSYSALGLLDAAEWFLSKPFSARELLDKIRQVLAVPPRRPAAR